MGRIELPTPSLPRKCSTAELHRLVIHLSGRRGSNPPPKAWKAFALPNELLPLDLWGRVDSNHRTDSRTDLQSVAIATMRLPRFNWAGRRTRTADRLITNQLLYQLSYTGMMWKNCRPLFAALFSPKRCAKIETFLQLTMRFLLFFWKKSYFFI